MKRALMFLGVFAVTQSAYQGIADAAEGAASFYLLGSKTSMAGFVPPPGTYVSNINYLYSGSASVNTKLDYAGVTAGVEISGPGGGTIATNVQDGDTAFGDPVLGASLGWHYIIASGRCSTFPPASRRLATWRTSGSTVGASMSRAL